MFPIPTQLSLLGSMWTQRFNSQALPSRAYPLKKIKINRRFKNNLRYNRSGFSIKQLSGVVAHVVEIRLGAY
jgi:hypothetical protein